jgi:hypothetical protein
MSSCSLGRNIIGKREKQCRLVFLFRVSSVSGLGAGDNEKLLKISVRCNKICTLMYRNSVKNPSLKNARRDEGHYLNNALQSIIEF